MKDVKLKILESDLDKEINRLNQFIHEGVEVEAGTITLTQFCGDDDTIVQINRTSVEKTGAKRAGVRDAIYRMVRHFHNTAIEQAFITFEVVCPKYVAVQWMRHRTFSYNELSLRYSEGEEAFGFHVPKMWREQGMIDKQATSDEGFESDDNENVSRIHNDLSMETYRQLRNSGVCREQARAVIPSGFKTRFFVSGNLHNWLHFLERRTDWHAQLEIRCFAEAIREVLHILFPHVLGAWERYRKNAVVLTEPMLSVIECYLKTKRENPDQDVDISALATTFSINSGEAREIEETVRRVLHLEKVPENASQQKAIGTSSKGGEPQESTGGCSVTYRPLENAARGINPCEQIEWVGDARRSTPE